MGPILKTLVFSTTPALARAWVDSICRDWDFRQIIPAHFTAPVPATPADLRAAFGFVYEEEQPSTSAAAASKPSGSANPAKALDGLLLGLLGGGGRAAAAKGPAVPPTSRAGVVYPPADIAALDSARRLLEGAGVVNKPS